MKVIVCVEGAPLGEGTRGALALAATLQPAAAVIALSATGTAAGAIEALAAAQRLGADRAAHLVDPHLAVGGAHDLGFALAEATRQLGAELVLAGLRSDREGRGIVPAAVAHHLGASYWAGVEAVTLDPADTKRVTIVVRTGGRKRTLSVALPAVLAIGPSAATPPIEKAEDAPVSPIESLPLADLRATGRNERRDELGALEKARPKPATATSAEELVRRWRGNT